MKILIALIFASFVVVSAAGGLPQPGIVILVYVMKEIGQLSERMAKLMGEAFPDLQAGAKDVSRNMDHCLENVNSRNVTVCAKLHAIVNECAAPIKEHYEQNLPESAKDIPKMIYESYGKVVHHVCNSKTEEFLELSNQCLFRPGTQEQRDQLGKAFEEKIKLFKAGPTKANLCEIVNGVRPLFEEAVKSSCQSDVTVKAFLACYDASAKPCRA